MAETTRFLDVLTELAKEMQAAGCSGQVEIFLSASQFNSILAWALPERKATPVGVKLQIPAFHFGPPDVSVSFFLAKRKEGG